MIHSVTVSLVQLTELSCAVCSAAELLFVSLRLTAYAVGLCFSEREVSISIIK